MEKKMQNEVNSSRTSNYIKNQNKNVDYNKNYDYTSKDMDLTFKQNMNYYKANYRRSFHNTKPYLNKKMNQKRMAVEVTNEQEKKDDLNIRTNPKETNDENEVIKVISYGYKKYNNGGINNNNSINNNNNMNTRNYYNKNNSNNYNNIHYKNNNYYNNNERQNNYKKFYKSGYRKQTEPNIKSHNFNDENIKEVTVFDYEEEKKQKNEDTITDNNANNNEIEDMKKIKPNENIENIEHKINPNYNDSKENDEERLKNNQNEKCDNLSKNESHKNKIIIDEFANSNYNPFVDETSTNAKFGSDLITNEINKETTKKNDININTCNNDSKDKENKEINNKEESSKDNIKRNLNNSYNLPKYKSTNFYDIKLNVSYNELNVKCKDNINEKIRNINKNIKSVPSSPIFLRTRINNNDASSDSSENSLDEIALQGQYKAFMIEATGQEPKGEYHLSKNNSRSSHGGHSDSELFNKNEKYELGEEDLEYAIQEDILNKVADFEDLREEDKYKELEIKRLLEEKVNSKKLIEEALRELEEENKNIKDHSKYNTNDNINENKINDEDNNKNSINESNNIINNKNINNNNLNINNINNINNIYNNNDNFINNIQNSNFNKPNELTNKSSQELNPQGLNETDKKLNNINNINNKELIPKYKFYNGSPYFMDNSQIFDSSLLILINNFSSTFLSNTCSFSNYVFNNYSFKFKSISEQLSMPKDYLFYKILEIENPGIIYNNIQNFDMKILLPLYKKIIYDRTKKLHILEEVFIRFKEVMSKSFYKAKINCIIEPYGSFKNNFMVDVGCDVDICLVPECKIHEFLAYLDIIKEGLKENNTGKYLETYYNGRYILLKYLDTKTNIPVDITIHNNLPIINTKLLRMYSFYDQRFHILGLYIKFWAKINKVHGAGDKFLSSYALLLLLIHFLQKVVEPRVLPNFQRIPINDDFDNPVYNEEIYTYEENNKVYKTNVYIEQDIEKIEKYMKFINKGEENRESAANLLVKFFEYYAYYFDNLQKISIHKSLSETIKDKPDDFAFSMEDPFDIEHNPGKYILLGSQTYNKFIQAMRKEVNFILSGEYLKREESLNYNNNISNMNNMNNMNNINNPNEMGNTNI